MFNAYKKRIFLGEFYHKKMESKRKYVSVVLIVLGVIFCASWAIGLLHKVPAGFVGVKVYLLGGSKGDIEILTPGRYLILWNEELHLFPTYQQNYVWTKSSNEGSPTNESFDFQTRDGLEVNADLGVSYTLRKDKIADIFRKYRRGVDEITNIYLRNIVRDAINLEASNLAIDSLYGPGKQIFMAQVQKRVVSQTAPIGINIDKIYLVGNLRLPNSVVEALNLKITATQRALQRENELREAEAEGRKCVVIAQAEAEALRIKNAQLTPSLLQYESIQKWDGKLPQATAGTVPFINLK